MAKRKNRVSLEQRNLFFEFQNREYKILSLCPNSMTVAIKPSTPCAEALREIPFAHLSKELKKIIKPN